jgi:hypothetical protein
VPEWLSPQLATGLLELRIIHGKVQLGSIAYRSASIGTTHADAGGIVAAGAMVTGLALAALRGTVEMLLEAAKRQLFVCAELDSRWGRL